MNGMTAVLEVLQEQCIDPAPPEAAAWLPLALQMSLRRIVRKCEGVLLRQYKLVQDLNDLASMQHMHRRPSRFELLLPDTVRLANACLVPRLIMKRLQSAQESALHRACCMKCKLSQGQELQCRINGDVQFK